MTTPNEMLDVVWILICAALVMLMQAGFACLESGSVRTKNSINVAAKNFADFCVSSAVFWLFGFAVMFGASYAGLLGTTEFLFNDTSSPWLMAFFIFQLGFCGTAATIISGAVAERMRFFGYLVITFILSGLIYPVVGHWVWGSAARIGSGGWLEDLGFIDFAGSTVVHSVGGWMSLVAILIIGPRIGRFGKDSVPIHGSALPMVTLGVFLLWFGWFGFNGGSTLGITPEVPTIIVNTTISGAFGGLVGLLISRWLTGRADVMMIMNGSLAGLVGITASAHIMTPLSAVGIGCIASVVMYGVTLLLERFEIDDVVGAVPVHLGAGIWGTLAVAVFGSPEAWGTGLGKWEQLSIQATGVIVVFAWAFGIGFSLLWLINRIYPLRIDPEGERVGLNISEHGASTEILDLLTNKERHRQTHDYSQPVPVEPHTEVGQIAEQYNRVLEEVNTEHARLKEATESLKKKTSSLLLLQKAAAAANEAKNIEDAIQSCLDDICAFTGWPVGHAFQVDDVTGELISFKIWHLDDPEKFKKFRKNTEQLRLPPEPGLSSGALETGEPTWIPDVTKHPQFYKFRPAEEIEVKGGFALPVTVADKVVAVLEFFSTEIVEPDKTVLEVMASVSTQLGRVIERTRSEAARFKTVIDNMPALVQLRDMDGRYILVNRKYEEYYGITNDMIRGKTLYEVDEICVYDLYPAENNLQDQEVKSSRTVIEKERKVTHNDEETTVTDVRFPILDSSGNMVAVAGIELDITERKRAEEKLEEAYEIIRDQKEKMEQELNIGREIQMSMVPQVFPAFPDREEIDIYAVLQPARQVGGDLYDFYFLDGSRLCFCIGDVSGKGVPAALFMAMTKTLIKSRSVDDYSTASIVTHVNDELSKDNKPSMFVTLILGILDVRSGELLYTNAGHNRPYIIRAGGELEVLTQRNGPIVGAMPGLAYNEQSIQLNASDVMVLYTDGVTEGMDREGTLYSDARFEDFLGNASPESLEDLINGIVSDVERFEAGAEQSDDITLLALEYRGVLEDEETHLLEIHIVNDAKEIDRINEEFNGFLEKRGIPSAFNYRFNVTFDELLSNIISYAYTDDDEHSIDIKIELSGDRLVVTISDDGIPYNPLSTAAPDTSLSVEEREAGGLGVHLVRNLMDDVSYQRKVDKNVTTLLHRLEFEE